MGIDGDWGLGDWGPIPTNNPHQIHPIPNFYNFYIKKK